MRRPIHHRSFSHASPSCAPSQLANNDMADAGLVGLLRTLRQPSVAPKLRYLGLAQNRIADAGAAALADHLVSAATPKLEHLELRENAIGDAGAEELARALPCARRLRHLSLYHNAIGRQGARALALALAQAPSLQALDLRLNLMEEGELR